jgi:translation initiation factor 2A
LGYLLISVQGQPAAVKVFAVPHFGAVVSQKSFYKGDKVQLKWNNSGTTLIVLAQTEVDRTGKSYYGETTLYLLSASGAFDSRIDLGMPDAPFPTCFQLE